MKVRNTSEVPGNNHIRVEQICNHRPCHDVNTENHITDWQEATIIDQEYDRTTRWIRKAVKIRQEGRDVMNSDEGVFLLSHVYHDLLLSAATTVATPSG